MNIIFFPILLSAAFIQYHNSIHQPYASFFNGKNDTPILIAKSSQSLYRFYLLPYKRYTLKITAPFLTSFIQEQAYNHHHTDIQLLLFAEANSEHNIAPKLLAQRKKLIDQYISASKQRYLSKDDVYQMIYQNQQLMKQLSPQVIKYYQNKNLNSIVSYMKVNGRSEALDTILFLLLNELSFQKESGESVKAQELALQNIYKNYAAGANLQETMDNVIVQMKNQELRLLCCLRRALTQWLKIRAPFKLEYLLRRPASCVYAPDTYAKLEQAINTMQEYDTQDQYKDYTSKLSQMIKIYKINYIVNNFRMLHNKDLKYVVNMLTSLLNEDHHIKVIVIDNANGKPIQTLDHLSVDLFFKDYA